MNKKYEKKDKRARNEGKLKKKERKRLKNAGLGVMFLSSASLLGNPENREAQISGVYCGKPIALPGESLEARLLKFDQAKIISKELAKHGFNLCVKGTTVFEFGGTFVGVVPAVSEKDPDTSAVLMILDKIVAAGTIYLRKKKSFTFFYLDKNRKPTSITTTEEELMKAIEESEKALPEAKVASNIVCPVCVLCVLCDPDYQHISSKVGLAAIASVEHVREYAVKEKR